MLSILIRLCWLAMAFCISTAVLASSEAPVSLKVGIVPYLSPKVLMSLFAPIRDHLEQQTTYSVELYTATDVPGYLRKASQRNFDVVIASAHLSRLLQQRAGYIPVAAFSNDLYGAVFVADNSTIFKLSDLRGKKLVVTDRSMLVNLAIFDVFQQKKWHESDFIIRPSVNQNAALLSVAKGENDAAIAAYFSLDQMPVEQAQHFREIFRTQALPNIIISLSPELSPKQQRDLRKAIMSLADTPSGAQFLKNSRFGGIKKVTPSSMAQLDKYLPETLKYLGSQ